MAILEQVKGALADALHLQKTNSVLGLDIGSSFVKVVQLRKDGEKAVLETYGELALGPYAGLEVGRAANLKPEQIIQAVLALFSEANITTKTGSVAIPLGSTLLSLIEMPKMNEAELAKTIPLEARKYIPVSISDVSLDWWIIPERKGEEAEEEEDETEPKEKKEKKTEVLIVAIHNEVLTKYNDIINRAELQNSSLEIETFSAVRSTLSHDMSPLMMLDLGAATTKLSLVEQGIIKSSHILNKGSQDITIALSHSLNMSMPKAEELKRKVGLLGEGDDAAASKVMEAEVDYILTEANRVLLNYQTKYRRTVTKVVLIGGGVLLKGFEDEAKKKLSTEVVYGDAFSKVQTPPFLEPVLKEAGPEFAVALGLALRRLQDL
ncbi:MAG TPA: type IV pilus assembly protein PilM [Candidatus Paceibacterota bacterium]|nr:type IV pilus assembly protein PilM [Candidatus Paceibacterota bacterium]